jgi:dienelactone hydrolase
MKKTCLLLLAALSAISLVHSSAPPFYADKSKLLVFRDAAGREHPVTTPVEWEKRRDHILANMQLIMGPLPDVSRKGQLDVRVNEEIRTSGYLRRKLSFAAEKGDRVPAYLLLPVASGGCRPPVAKHPAVVCLHQTISIGKGEPVGLGGSPNLHYAAELAERGYVTLAPDYPSFGDYRYDFKRAGAPQGRAGLGERPEHYQSGSLKAIWNNMRAVDLLQSLPEVDPERIGCIGHSLGGHNAMFTAAFDTRIKAVVSSCGFTSFPRYFGGNLKGWTSDRYMPRIASLYDSKPEKMPFDFTEVVAALAPRAFLASAPLHDDNFEVSGVRDVMAAAKPVYQLLGAGEKLAANYPDCRHDFPPQARKLAYEWLDRWLRGIQ